MAVREQVRSCLGNEKGTFWDHSGRFDGGRVHGGVGVGGPTGSLTNCSIPAFPIGR